MKRKRETSFSPQTGTKQQKFAKQYFLCDDLIFFILSFFTCRELITMCCVGKSWLESVRKIVLNMTITNKKESIGILKNPEQFIACLERFKADGNSFLRLEFPIKNENESITSLYELIPKIPAEELVIMYDTPKDYIFRSKDNLTFTPTSINKNTNTLTVQSFVLDNILFGEIEKSNISTLIINDCLFTSYFDGTLTSIKKLVIRLPPNFFKSMLKCKMPKLEELEVEFKDVETTLEDEKDDEDDEDNESSNNIKENMPNLKRLTFVNNEDYTDDQYDTLDFLLRSCCGESVEKFTIKHFDTNSVCYLLDFERYFSKVVLLTPSSYELMFDNLGFYVQSLNTYFVTIIIPSETNDSVKNVIQKEMNCVIDPTDCIIPKTIQFLNDLGEDITSEYITI